jgi:hypothetical protein
MELKEFIKETLISITEGVVESQKYLNEKNLESEINPKIQTKWESTGYTFSESGKPVQKVDFDVDVTADEKKGGSGSLGIKVSAIGIGGSRKKETSKGSNSRIKFSIPITLPH